MIQTIYLLIAKINIFAEITSSLRIWNHKVYLCSKVTSNSASAWYKVQCSKLIFSVILYHRTFVFYGIECITGQRIKNMKEEENNFHTFMRRCWYDWHFVSISTENRFLKYVLSWRFLHSQNDNKNIYILETCITLKINWDWLIS